MNILIYEHASAGGFAESAVSPSILAEGFGMLRSLVTGLKSAGHRVTVIVAAELIRFNPALSADCIIPVFSFHEAQQAILRVCTTIDAVYIIAPETGGALHSLVEFVEQNGVPTLNCSSKAIQAVSNKAVLYETLSSNGLKIPRTIMLDKSDSIIKDIERRFSFPVVFKPLDGVGCSGISLVKDRSQIVNAVAKIDAELASEKFVVQEYLEGEAVSVSLLCTSSDASPFSLNKQEIDLLGPEETSVYVGGCVPYDHELKLKAFEVAKAVAGCFSGLRGYVGVDLILTEKEPVVVDVNPRLTTSFIGLNRVACFNFTDALVCAALKGELPRTSGFSGFAVFSKVETSKPDIAALEKISSIPSVISPPFPILDSDSACTFILGEGDSIDTANMQLEEAKKKVLDSV